jgi:ArsR family transcriptional regulator
MFVNMYGMSQACCPPIATTTIGQRDAVKLSALLKVLADPARLRIVSILAAADDEVCVCDLTAPLDLSQPTVSHHMKQLKTAGFVESERRGKWIFYRLVPERLEAVTTALGL